jgi:transcriptional regulator with XRE-family HTH domain
MINLSDAQILGAAIRSGRSALNWSQQLLADKSGISLPTIARIETGSNNPKLDTVSRLIQTIEGGGVEYSWIHPNGFGMVVTLPKKRK